MSIMHVVSVSTGKDSAATANCHRQLVVCNRHGAGRAVDYRLGLIQRIGLERVEALEASNEPHKWNHPELIEIRARYKAKRRALEAACVS